MKKSLLKNICLVSVIALVLVIAFTCDSFAVKEISVLTELQEKTAKFAKNLRILAYIISGFGIIAFTFMAIGGKISFKHLGYIYMSLFILSGTGALIDYFSGNSAGLKLSSKLSDTYMKATPRSSLSAGSIR